MAGSLNQGEILIYQTEKGDTKVDVFLADETVWMTRNNIAALYSTTPQNISRHIKNIYEENELDETATRKQNFLVQYEGTREVTRKTNIYNIDMILAIGYRVRSSVGNQFRRWASSILLLYFYHIFIVLVKLHKKRTVVTINTHIAFLSLVFPNFIF